MKFVVAGSVTATRTTWLMKMGHHSINTFVVLLATISASSVPSEAVASQAHTTTEEEIGIGTKNKQVALITYLMAKNNDMLLEKVRSMISEAMSQASSRGDPRDPRRLAGDDGLSCANSGDQQEQRATLHLGTERGEVTFGVDADVNLYSAASATGSGARVLKTDNSLHVGKGYDARLYVATGGESKGGIVLAHTGFDPDKGWQLDMDNNNGDLLFRGFSDVSSGFIPENAHRRFRITTQGDVGIGTTPNSARLHVHRASAGETLVRVTSSTSQAAVQLASAATDGRAYVLASTAAGAFHVWDDTANTARFTVNADGSVAIAGELNVGGNVKITGSGIAGVTQGIKFASGNQVQIRAEGGADLSLITSNSHRVRVKQNGNVGVGTTAPQHALDVVHSGKRDVRVRVVDLQNSGGKARFEMLRAASAESVHAAGWQVTDTGLVQLYRRRDAKTSGDTTDLSVVTEADAGTEKIHLTVNEAGSVGVGTADPKGTLHVMSGGFHQQRWTNSEAGGKTWDLAIGDSGLLPNRLSFGHISESGDGGVGGGPHVSAFSIDTDGNAYVGGKLCLGDACIVDTDLNKLHASQLCVGGTCITEDELKTMKAAIGGSSATGNLCLGSTCVTEYDLKKIAHVKAEDLGANGCTSSKPCSLGQGDCDQDGHCAGSLICHNSGGPVPGVDTTGMPIGQADVCIPTRCVEKPWSFGMCLPFDQ